ncbi:hypothetical protein Save01_07909 [Streptomyces avermitilis]
MRTYEIEKIWPSTLTKEDSSAAAARPGKIRKRFNSYLIL